MDPPFLIYRLKSGKRGLNASDEERKSLFASSDVRATLNTFYVD